MKFYKVGENKYKRFSWRYFWIKHEILGFFLLAVCFWGFLVVLIHIG